MSRASRLALALAALSLAAPAASPQVEAFSPQPGTKFVRQIALRFSAAFAPLGDSRAVPDPARVHCNPAAPGAGRWVSPSEWVYDFDAQLPGAARCDVRLQRGLRSLAGERVGGPQRFALDTGGPAVLSIAPAPDARTARIPEDARFALRLDALPRAREIERLAHLEHAGTNARVALRVVSGAERDAILAALTRTPLATDVVLAPRAPLASSSEYALVWPAGISANGVASTSEQRFLYTTRDPLALFVACERGACDPQTGVSLEFNAVMEVSPAVRFRLIPLGEHARLAPRELAAEVQWRGHRKHLTLTARGPFPQRSRWRAELPGGLRDVSGRSFTRSSPLIVEFGSYSPHASFRGRFAIAEPDGAAWRLQLHAAPAHARLREGHLYLAKLSAAEQARELVRWLEPLDQWDPSARGAALLAPGAGRALPATPDDEALSDVALPIRGLGLHAAGIDGAPSDPRRPQFSLVHVTELAMHVKSSHDSALVWVTRLRDAAPVADARVRLFDCAQRLLASGRTGADGVALLEKFETRPACVHGFLALAQRGDDVAFLQAPSAASTAGDWSGYRQDFGEPYPLVHVALARSLLRRGETLHGKLFVRLPTLAGMASPPPNLLAGETKLPIEHLGSGEEFEGTLAANARGDAVFTWEVPPDAPLGMYQLTDLGVVGGARFRVEDFKPPLVTGSISLGAGAETAPEQLPVELALSYLSGGPAANLGVELRSRRSVGRLAAPDGYEEFAFDAGEPSLDESWRDLDEGDGLTLVAPWAKEQREIDEAWADESEGPPPPVEAALTLDAEGRGRALLKPPQRGAAETVLVEASFRDPNGATQTLAQRFEVRPSAVSIGVSYEPRAAQGEGRARVHARAVVLGRDAKPVPGAPIELEWVVLAREDEVQRLPGDFSLATPGELTTTRTPICEGTTDAAGLVACDAELPEGEDLFVVARTRDAAGRRASTHEEAHFYFPSRLDERIELTADKRLYVPGESARIEVKTPFETATALVTIEREGIAERRIAQLSGPSTTLELPLRASFAPNIHVAVLALSGSRGPGPEPAAPRAPDAAAASISLRVEPTAYELAVDVTTDRAEYRPGATAHARIRARTADGAPLPRGGEVALAVVDEALLELWPNEGWELAAFLRAERPRSVGTLTTQPLAVESRAAEPRVLASAPSIAGESEEIVVTARKREEGLQDAAVSVSAPTKQTVEARARFDSLVLWRGSVPLAADGTASAEIPLNDLLTRLRIVALASAGADRFGAGAASVRTTQPLQIYSGVAPLARDGDRARVEFTLRNASERALELQARLEVEGGGARFTPVALRLAPGEARPIHFNVEIPAGVASLTYDLVAEARDGAVDRLRVVQRVLPSVPERVLQAALLQVDGEASLPVVAPPDAVAGRGGVDVSLRRSLASGTSALREYFERYPFSCLEQKASIAVGLRDAARWRDLAGALAAQLDAHGFAKFWPSSRDGSDTLTAYLLSIAHAADYAIPEEPRERMLGALAAFVSGRAEPPRYFEAPDRGARRLAALAAISRYRDARPDLLAAIPREQPELWPTSALLDAVEVATRWPSAGLPRERLVALVRARLVLGGTTLVFANEERDRLDWLLASGDLNAVRIVLLAQDDAALGADSARLLKGALARQVEGRWDTTLANAWGRLALEAFAARHEATPVAGATRAQLGAAVADFAWTEASDPAKQRLAWPPALANLTLRHAGTGRPWAEVQSVVASPVAKPRFDGFRIARAWTPLAQRDPGRWSRGDVVRVRLELEALGSSAWVAVSDAVPPGATILGSGLGRDSALLASGERGARARWSCPCLEYAERSFEAYREYYGWVPAGRWSVEYTLRLDQAGEFALPPTRAEAMYAPESFGELPHERVVVGE